MNRQFSIIQSLLLPGQSRVSPLLEDAVGREISGWKLRPNDSLVVVSNMNDRLLMHRG